MIVWKDVSSYALGDKNREVNTVQALVGPLRANLHRHIRHPGKWLLSLHRGWIDQRVLEAVSLDDAKAEAVEIIKSETARILAAFLPE